MRACSVTGHRMRFWNEGATMRWACERGCEDAAGSKSYPTPEQARRYARALDRDDTTPSGWRRPLTLLPLRFLARGRRGG